MTLGVEFFPKRRGMDFFAAPTFPCLILQNITPIIVRGFGRIFEVT